MVVSLNRNELGSKIKSNKEIIAQQQKLKGNNLEIWMKILAGILIKIKCLINLFLGLALVIFQLKFSEAVLALQFFLWLPSFHKPKLSFLTLF